MNQLKPRFWVCATISFLGVVILYTGICLDEAFVGATGCFIVLVGVLALE